MTEHDNDEKMSELADWTVPPPPAGLVDRAVALAEAPRPAVAREAFSPPRSGLRLAVMLVAASAGGAAIASGFWAAAYERRSHYHDGATGEPGYSRRPDLPPMDQRGVIAAVAVDAGPVSMPPPVSTTRKVPAGERDRVAKAIADARDVRHLAAASAPDPLGPAPVDDQIALDPADIQAAVRDVAPLLAECFDMAPQSVRSHGGKLVTEMTVRSEPDVGTVIDDAAFPDGDGVLLGDADFTQCVHETLMSVEMPPLPDDGGEVVIRYPFVFSDGAPDDAPPAEPSRMDGNQQAALSAAQLVELAAKHSRAAEYPKALHYAVQALNLEPANQYALTIAAIAACNLKDAESAQRYIKKLSGTRAGMAKQICLRNGLEL